MISYFASLSYQSSSSFAAQSIANGRQTNVSVTSDQQVSLSFRQGVQDGVGVQLADEPQNNPATPLFDVGKVVDTVLGFIENRLGEARGNGASDERLNNLFDAAREGVETGFAQARDQIDALGRLNDDLADNIDNAESGIQTGIDDLQVDFGLAEAEAEIADADLVYSPESLIRPLPNEPRAEDSEEPRSGNLTDAIRDGLDLAGLGARPPSLNEALSVYAESLQSFEFELTTQEGDRVSISASALESFFAESSVSRRGAREVSAEGFAAEFSQAFDLTVNGDLNEEEVAAIGELLTQVVELSDLFYEGDVEAAFGLALEINSDPSQIASFSLDLLQEQTLVTEYSRNQSVADQPLPRGIGEPLRDFAAATRDAFETANRFAEPRALLEELLERFDRPSEESPASGSGLTQSLLDQLEALS